MQFKELATYIQKIEQTSSRNDITKFLADLFGALSPKELHYAIYLIQGNVSPKFNVINFGMAEKMVIRAVASASQTDIEKVTAEFKKIGDIGEVTEKIKLHQPSLTEKDVSIVEAFDRLLEIAQAGGDGSQDKKIQLLAALVNELDALSARYIVRIPLGVLRLGFSDMTILDSLSWMKTGDKSLRPSLQKAYQVRPDLGLIGALVKQKDIKEVEKIEPEVFTPIIMMRAERLSSGAEIIDQIGKCAIEPKFDGFRLQVHKKGKEVKLFTRGLEDATFMYPDIVEGIQKEIHAKDVILEGEAIGFDPQSESFLPFQETVQRKRKYGIDEKAKEIPLKLFAFELLYADGKSYIDSAFVDRRKALEHSVDNKKNVVEDTIIIAHNEIVEDPKKVELIFEDNITKGLEGIIAKKLDGTYQPGARGWNWIKFKRSYSSKIEDTIDCLVMGYDYGKGKRAGFGIGAFLVGVYDAKEDKYLTVAKIGTGLKDQDWIDLKAKAKKITVDKVPNNYEIDKLMECDVWVTPEVVVEIKADEITRSPVHTAGRVMKPTKSGNAMEVEVAGFALRFPRLVRFREDKTPQDATSVTEVSKMFKSQRV